MRGGIAIASGFWYGPGLMKLPNDFLFGLVSSTSISFKYSILLLYIFTGLAVTIVSCFGSIEKKMSPYVIFRIAILKGILILVLYVNI